MASIGIIILSLVGIFFIHDAVCNKFVTLHRSKSEIVAEYGTNTILLCEIKTQQQETKIDTVIWRFNNNPVLAYHNKKFIKKENGFEFAEKQWHDTNLNVSLLITKTNVSHAGTYECEVMTDTGGEKAEIHLKVKANYSKPKISSNLEKIKPNEDFTLTCEAHGGFPKGDLRWFANDELWNGKPEEEQKENKDTGLWDLTSKLSFNQDTLFTKFMCEVRNTNGIKVGEETFHKLPKEKQTGNNDSKLTQTQIVAPVVVIGSLIVGLLLVLLVRRRRQRSDRTDVPPEYCDEETGDPMVSLKIDNRE